MPPIKPIVPVVPVKPVVKEVVDDAKTSGEKLEKMRAGRNLGDIPIDDEYWDAQRKHQELVRKTSAK